MYLFTRWWTRKDEELSYAIVSYFATLPPMAVLNIRVSHRSMNGAPLATCEKPCYAHGFLYVGTVKWNVQVQPPTNPC